MVVTRRTTIPMPPASRAASTQDVPKINKGKTLQSSLLVHEIEESLSNGSPSEGIHAGPQFSDDALFSDGSPPRKTVKDKSKVKTKRREGKSATKRKKRPASWLDIFSRMFILAFLIYSLSVCPTADKQTSPVCRALSEYRRLVLEPYVITPIQNLLHHPSVSPYTTTIVEKTQPIVARSREEWNSRLVPQWEAHVVPQWEKRIVPAWVTYVSPQLARLDAKVDPYRQQIIELYGKHAAPYVKEGRVIAQKTQPYVVLAAARTYDTYQTSKPYLARLYRELQRIPPIIAKYVISPLASARRQYVDPHVAVLLEKIQELSSGTTKSNVGHDGKVSSTSVPVSMITKEAGDSSRSIEIELPVTSQSSSGDETLASASSVASASLSLETTNGKTSSDSEPTKERDTLASASSIISASLILSEEITESVLGATYSPKPQNNEAGLSLGQDKESKVELKSAYFVEHADGEETVVVQRAAAETLKAPSAETSAENFEVASSNVLDVATDDATPPSIIPNNDVQSPVSATIEVPKAHRPPVPPSASASSDDELEDLLAELGLDADETVTSDPPPAPSVKEETEEEKAAREARRLAEVAAKRRELEARHTRWEEKLAETIEAQTASLKEALASIRRTGAAELKINLAIRAAIETLNSEGEKALRGIDSYFAKLRAGGKPRAEQARLWERVLEKVQSKFENRVDDVEETVNKWYQEEVLSRENQEIEKASDAVRTVADDAQADIGLDYAWLDDVSYMDWRRYHALLDKHRTFLDEQLALANGTRQNAYPNAVLDAFEDLQAEVRDITLGFETRMRRIKREGERAFAEERSETEQAVPEVSVLPITDNGKKEDKAFQEVADAILGRSEEEVAAALNRAEEQQTKAAHEEL